MSNLVMSNLKPYIGNLYLQSSDDGKYVRIIVSDPGNKTTTWLVGDAPYRVKVDEFFQFWGREIHSTLYKEYKINPQQVALIEYITEEEFLRVESPR